MSAEQKQAVFRPQVYEVDTLEQAKRVIVTAEPGTSTEERWETETAYLSDQIGRRACHRGHAAVDRQGVAEFHRADTRFPLGSPEVMQSPDRPPIEVDWALVSLSVSF